ncbi:glycosyltransferase family 2 protein [Anaerostipes hadrus]|uniref:glycosyltransferase family 2 protein n=1 Tax=Anaerostipes hadrus TaxID=649756 RepID=UPI001ADD8965|nr:glycosyltransferase family 2 protein [Anaerostipes hadrus]MBP0051151.1 glycosyltransferase family 2 protein [Anaerostipes hadrus]MBP0054569.1 glycosyltransferase family 2 protein [Anaerostipes hadrus]
MDEKLVSVIIPAYNIEDYIGRCLDSIISQTYKNLEIIVVDDGSRDHTGEILDNYAKKDRRIKVIHKENGGVSSARNKGIEVAEGDYIGFIDGDDLIEPEMYKILVDLLEEENADIAHCGYQMVFPDRVDYYHNTGKKKIQTTEEGLKDLLSGEIIEPGLVNKLYKKELIKNCRLDETVKINEDLLMNYQLFKLSQKSVYYDITPYSYMIRSSSATGANSLITKREDSLRVLNQIKDDCINNNLLPTIYKRYIYLLMAICRDDLKDRLYMEYQKKQRKKLKKELKTDIFKSCIPKKLKYMSLFSCYLPHIMKIIYKMYDLKTGTSKKYLVNGE